ncbi:hypothetical protein HPP92_022246 [Vanilla planifolia]|uniref:Uncharacterized protein n=1 Tax=Vanilla planifolia TaxID=51239 RepID=A0A835PUE2_VANPL|nr:hypothetical protein HPP92_022246 [Vanilla planifolia]
MKREIMKKKYEEYERKLRDYDYEDNFDDLVAQTYLITIGDMPVNKLAWVDAATWA